MADNTIHMMQLEKAMEQYEKLIFSICYRMLGDYFDAQDMTQETFLTYYRVLDRFDGQNEKAFLTKIATNKCLDILKSKRRKEMPAEDDILESNVGTVSSIEETFLEEEINQELINACRDLKPPYNEVAYEFHTLFFSSSNLFLQFHFQVFHLYPAALPLKLFPACSVNPSYMLSSQ